MKLFSAAMFFLSNKLHKPDDNMDDKQSDNDQNEDVYDTLAMESSAVNGLAHI